VWNGFAVPMTIFLGLMPFNIACDLARTSMFRMRLLALFSLNVICRMAESIGFPEICRPSLLSFLCDILKFAVEYLCCTTYQVLLVRTCFSRVHDHSALSPPQTALSHFVVVVPFLLLRKRQHQRRFGFRPQLWRVSWCLLRDSIASVENRDSQ